MNLADSLDERITALTVPDLGKLLNISERQVDKLAASNRIPSFKIGGSVRFDPSAFAVWLRGRMVPVPVRSARAGRDPKKKP
jgi:excisionase family DNA binding protein